MIRLDVYSGPVRGQRRWFADVYETEGQRGIKLLAADTHAEALDKGLVALRRAATEDPRP